MDNYVYRNFEMRNRYLSERVVNSKDAGPGLLMVELDDGSRFMYDDFDTTIRRLPKDPESLSEHECRVEFGFSLRRLMDRKCVTQAELAAITNIPQYLISKYINGKTTPSFYNVDKIAKALKCSVDDLRYTN